MGELSFANFPEDCAARTLVRATLVFGKNSSRLHRETFFPKIKPQLLPHKTQVVLWGTPNFGVPRDGKAVVLATLAISLTLHQCG